MKPIAGSQFRSIDFHIHTPESGDYKDKQATAEDIVNPLCQYKVRQLRRNVSRGLRQFRWEFSVDRPCLHLRTQALALGGPRLLPSVWEG